MVEVFYEDCLAMINVSAHSEDTIFIDARVFLFGYLDFNCVAPIVVNRYSLDWLIVSRLSWYFLNFSNLYIVMTLCKDQVKTASYRY